MQQGASNDAPWGGSTTSQSRSLVPTSIPTATPAAKIVNIATPCMPNWSATKTGIVIQTKGQVTIQPVRSTIRSIDALIAVRVCSAMIIQSGVQFSRSAGAAGVAADSIQ